MNTPNTAKPPSITRGKKRAPAPPPEVIEPTPVELVSLSGRPGYDRPVFIDEDAGTGTSLILVPGGDAFDLWVRVQGRGARVVTVSPRAVLRMMLWVLWFWWVRTELCGLRTYLALRRARRAALTAQSTR